LLNKPQYHQVRAWATDDLYRSLLVKLCPKAALFSLCCVFGLVACGGARGNFEDPSKLQAKIANLEKGTPLPPGSHFDTNRLQIESGHQYEIGFWDNTVQGQAQCKWYMYWVRSRTAGETANTQAAEAMFAQMHTWHLYTTADISYTQLVDRIESQAQLGDPSGIQRFVELNCVGISP
jgi:hypothetical protein